MGRPQWGDHNTLPLLLDHPKSIADQSARLRSLAVIGPFANSTRDLMGGYSGLNERIASHAPGAVLQRRLAAASPSTQVRNKPR
jgi:hypothetical protein